MSIIALPQFFQKAINQTLFKRSTCQQRAVEHKGSPNKGRVYLIGAGCGDPELLTIKAHRLLQSADVIMVDWLVHHDMYAYFNTNAERIFVGKKCGRHSMTQAEICKLLVEKASQGKTVVRLKGGDPSIFGRLAEETDALTQHDIPFAIVPGVTAASGCAAYSGIPLTHRDVSQSVKFVTAHLQHEHAELHWDLLAQETGSLVFYMGLNRLGKITGELIKHGMDKNMPIAIVDQGTTSQQQVVSATLSTIDTEANHYDLAGPALIIVGKTVQQQQAVNVDLLQLGANIS